MHGVVDTMLVAFVVAVFNGLTNEHRREVGKDEGLNGCYQQFQEEHEDGEYHRHRRETPAGNWAHGSEDEDEHHYAKDNDVARQHVGEQSDSKCDRLNEKGDNFDRDKQELNAQWNARGIEKVTPEVLVGIYQQHDEGDECKAKQ